MADRRDNLGAVKKLSQKLSSQFISTTVEPPPPRAAAARNQGYSSPTELPLAATLKPLIVFTYLEQS